MDVSIPQKGNIVWIHVTLILQNEVYITPRSAYRSFENFREASRSMEAEVPIYQCNHTLCNCWNGYLDLTTDGYMSIIGAGVRRCIVSVRVIRRVNRTYNIPKHPTVVRRLRDMIVHFVIKAPKLAHL